MKKQNNRRLTLNLVLILAAILGLIFVSPANAKELKQKRVITIDFSKPETVKIHFEPLIIIGTIKK